MAMQEVCTHCHHKRENHVPDLLDALRLALKVYNIEKNKVELIHLSNFAYFYSMLFFNLAKRTESCIVSRIS
jgi:hypothetical protein